MRIRENSPNQYVGKTFGRLTVTDEIMARFGDQNRHAFVCDCSCGTKGLIYNKYTVMRGSTKSCGCLRKEACAANGRKCGAENLRRYKQSAH